MRKQRIEIIATQCGVTTSGHHLEHALGEAQNGNVEGATTQVVYGVEALRTGLQAIGQGCRGGFIEQPQDIQACKACRILRGLTLCVIEIGRHRDHRPDQLISEGLFRLGLEHLQNVG